MKTEDIKLFHKVVEFGSLTETAKWLDLPKSNISRRIKQLEDEAGIKLFHRHSRNVTLTPSGEQFYESTLSIISDLEQTIFKLQTPEKELKGKIKVMIAPSMLNIGKVVFEFISSHPNIEAEVITSPYDQDLITNDIDVAFRVNNEISQENLVARELGKEVYGLYASPSYISKYGKPSSIEALVDYEMIVFRFNNGQLHNKLYLDNGDSICPKGNLIVNNLALMMEAAIQGKGLIFIPKRTGTLFVNRGLLELVLPEYAPRRNFAWLVHSPRQYLSTEAEAFLDFALERIEQVRYRDSDLVNVLRIPFNPVLDEN
ncbi:LysR family transcriptional regulator [Photobacterium rosenbergii]|uniref:LysR family transcriptional regulator n=1 Tax=Photobacterium rosenbergii TaxID=294936 RepID=UPI001C9A14F0|nr:LysR family transcriptional regulator [Photobacterium rosenbergii]MBY5946880.1 LysR family transcriptional regulator [Photobacterium rosenbergii]